MVIVEQIQLMGAAVQENLIALGLDDMRAFWVGIRTLPRNRSLFLGLLLGLNMGGAASHAGKAEVKRVPGAAQRSVAKGASPVIASSSAAPQKGAANVGIQAVAQECTAQRESEGLSRVIAQFHSLWPETAYYVTEIPDLRRNSAHSCHARTRALGDGSLFVNYFDAVDRRDGTRAALVLDQLDRAMGCLSARQMSQYSLYFLAIMDESYRRSESKISLKCRSSVQREWSALVLNPTLRLLEKRRMMGGEVYRKLQRLIPAVMEAASRPESRFQSHGVWVSPKNGVQGLAQLGKRCSRNQRGLLTLRNLRDGAPTCDGSIALLSALSRPETLGMGECALGELAFLGASPAVPGQKPQQPRMDAQAAFCPLSCMGAPRADQQTEASREFYEGVESQGLTPFGAPLPSLQSLCQQVGQRGAAGGGAGAGAISASDWGGASGCISSLGQSSWRAMSEGRNTQACRPKGADLQGAMSAGDLSAFQIDRKCIGSVMNEGPNGEAGPASPGVSDKVKDVAGDLLAGASGTTSDGDAKGKVKPDIGKAGVGVKANGALNAGGTTLAGTASASVKPGGDVTASVGVEVSTSLGGGTLTAGGKLSGSGDLSTNKQTVMDFSGGDTTWSAGVDYTKDLGSGGRLSVGVKTGEGGGVTGSVGVGLSFMCPPDSASCSSSCTSNELSDSISQECLESAGIGLGERAVKNQFAKGFDSNAKNPVQRAGFVGGRSVGGDGEIQTWGVHAESELSACLQAQNAWSMAGAECQMAINCGEDRAPVKGPNGTCSCGGGVAGARAAAGSNAQIGMARARFRACTQSQGAGPDGADANGNGGPCALWGGLDRDNQGPSLGGDPLIGGNGGGAGGGSGACSANEGEADGSSGPAGGCGGRPRVAGGRN